MRSLLATLALIACAVYATIPLFWFTLHPFTKHWRARGRHSFKLILPLWLAYIVIAIAVLYPWRNQSLYTTPYAYIPGGLLVLTGLLLYVLSSRGFTHVQLSGLAEVEPDRHAQRLVTTGIRARVRHPIYLGHLCELLGWTICFGTVSLIALSAFAIVTGYFMLRLEDRELEDRFGPEYTAYRQRVPAIIPRVFLSS
ncbi:Putative protein-S-isoprenylcysteine methyltransferase-like protein [Candidatus Koribacter versatilis Ellin345]|uniref:Isoprenylcysteine carboxyl methyltransferase n=1 Tax=Koribacter versatilis (strain Ellin345) TaxID=204669 RepID=Q1IKN3_KORVE|nr:isoprenylcysteine carboxylmethyltransferase family protein [Candidatus Koribacter versatilis]ABF42567.1 Putative protein-S-isoprenylcysteine methyltransferase-like protein [Candidatus Koribacter versatilis Ellin345]